MDYLMDDNAEWGRYNYPGAYGQEDEYDPYGGVPEGYMNTDYWQQRNDTLAQNPNMSYPNDTPSTPRNTAVEDMFDLETGQLRPGWQRTARGYEWVGFPTTPNSNVQDPPPGPPPPPPGGPGGGDGRITFGGFTRQPTAPVGSAPQFPSAGIVDYPAFQAPAAFKAPSAADMINDPGFNFRRQMGEDAIKRNAASLGKLRTGGTHKGLIDYNQNFASLEYGNVYERAATEYDRMYNNLIGEYKLGYQQALDRGDQDFRLTSAQFAPRLREWELGEAAKQRAAELEYLREQDIWKTIYNAGAD